MIMIVIDATDLLVGRMATFVAKAALKGEKVAVVNCENAVISGSKSEVIAKYKRKKEMGIPSKGPFQPRFPDRFVRRIIRGMLPYKKPKGRDAYRRVMCYIGTPEHLKENDKITIEAAKVDKLPTLKYIKVEDICKELGYKV